MKDKIESNKVLNEKRENTWVEGEQTFTVRTVLGFEYIPPDIEPEEIKITSSIYDVFKNINKKKITKTK
jgi:hypothetical protein